jgi:hypothetical protein
MPAGTAEMLESEVAAAPAPSTEPTQAPSPASSAPEAAQAPESAKPKTDEEIIREIQEEHEASEKAKEKPEEPPPAAAEKTEDEPPQPEGETEGVFTVDGQEYSEEDIRGAVAAQKDWAMLEELFKNYPGMQQAVNDAIQGFIKGTRTAPSDAKEKAAPADAKPSEIDAIIQKLPEELSGPLGELLRSQQDKISSIERANAERADAEDDFAVAKEFDEVVAYAKERGYPAPDERKVREYSYRLGGIPYMTAYRDLYADEIAVSKKSAAQETASSAKAGAVAAGNKANGSVKALPRPGVAAKTPPPPRKKVGEMNDAEFLGEMERAIRELQEK